MEMMVYNFLPRNNIRSAPWIYHKDIFSDEECDILLGPNIGQKGNIITSTYTNVELRNISWRPEVDWLFTRLHRIISGTNAYWFNFDLDGIQEQLERFTYGPHGSMDWHIDSTPEDTVATTRKLTFAIQLSEPSTYEGGELEFFCGKSSVAPKERGAVVLWPSFIYHRVLELREGTRTSLVGHAYGVPFR